MLLTMRPWKSTATALCIAASLAGGPLTRVAHAGKAEASDLKRQIDSQRAAISDLERVDDGRRASGEVALLRSWLDEADALHAKESWDKVRIALDRCIAQAELIRQKTLSGKLTAQAEEREKAAAASKDKLEHTKKQLADAQVNKKALEMNAK